MTRYLVSNVSCTKGVIVNALDADEARRIAHTEFYGAYTALYEMDLCQVQAYDSGKNFPFNSCNGAMKFKKVQFNFWGNNGAGVTTSYDCSIDTELSDKQISFIGSSEVKSIVFFNTDTPQGNYGDKIGNKTTKMPWLS